MTYRASSVSITVVHGDVIWAWTPPVLAVVVLLVFIVAQMDLQQAYLVM